MLPEQRVVPLHLHAGRLQKLTIRHLQPLRAKGIQQTAHGNTTLSRRAERLEQGFATGSAFHQIEFQFDLSLRSVDARQHLHEKLRPVDQQRQCVTASPRKDVMRHDGSCCS